MNYNLYQKLKSGSVLAMSLIILSIVMVLAIGISSVTVTEMRSSQAGDESMKAFQVADTGVGKVIVAMNAKIASGSIPDSTEINDIFTCDNSTKTVSGTAISSNDYKVTFWNDNTPVADKLACNAKISEIAQIKSVGELNGTKRAIETAWAAGTDIGWEMNSHKNSGADVGNIVAALTANMSEASCSSGKKLLGGGCKPDPDTSIKIISSYPGSDTTWFCAVNPADVAVTAYAICADVQ